LYNLCLNNKKAGKEGLSLEPKTADNSNTAKPTLEAALQGGVARNANKKP
jgi:hypothetical protein